MTVDRVIHRIRLIGRDDSATDAAWVAFAAGMVVATGVGEGWRDLAPREADDGSGSLLAPGFVDIHGHGGGGLSYDDGGEAIAVARAVHRAHGTTRAVLSLVTASLPALAARAALVAELAAADPTILGSHLEGPFLHPDHGGAHPAALLRAPEPAALDALLTAGRGTVRQITLAPELAGGIDAVRRVVAAGAAAAIGHTGADADIARRAFDAGATILTHAFNAMPGIHHRSPGPVVAALDDDRVTLELIADGVHVHPSVLRLAMDAAPGRIALITDAMAGAGASDGTYDLGGRSVGVRGGVARLGDGGALAGSTLTQDAALRRAVFECGMPLADAVAAVTAVPAHAVGRGGDLGRLAPGYAADAVLLSPQLRVERVWVEGRPVPATG